MHIAPRTTNALIGNEQNYLFFEEQLTPKILSVCLKFLLSFNTLLEFNWSKKKICDFFVIKSDQILLKNI